MGQRRSSKVPFLSHDFLLLPELTATSLGLCLGCSWDVGDRLEMLLLAWVAFWCLLLKMANSFLSYSFIFINSCVPPYIFSMLCSLHMYRPLYQKWKAGLLVTGWVRNTKALSCLFVFIKLNDIIACWLLVLEIISSVIKIFMYFIAKYILREVCRFYCFRIVIHGFKCIMVQLSPLVL